MKYSLLRDMFPYVQLFDLTNYEDTSSCFIRDTEGY